MFNTNPCWCF